jgi:hypothetical protein
VIGLVAHGGWAGLAIEIAAVLGIVALGLAVWVANRRDRRDEET